MGNSNKKEKKEEVSELPPKYQTISELINPEKEDILYQKEFKNFIYSLLKEKIPKEIDKIRDGKLITLGFSQKSDDVFKLIDLKMISKNYNTYEQALKKKYIERLTYFMMRNNLSPSSMCFLRDKWNAEFEKQVKLYYRHSEKYHTLWCEIYDMEFPIIV